MNNLLLTASLACISDITNNITNYWYAIKYPQGFKYSYGEESHGLAPSDYDMQDTDRGALALTVSQLWNNPNASYIIYNDESAMNETYNSNMGHTKGILATDGEFGFWLQHSTPKYPIGPTYTADYKGLTSNGFDYGQHFLCVSLTNEEIQRLAGHMKMNRPAIQDSRIVDNGHNLKNFTELATGDYTTSPQCDTIIIEYSGHRWTVFAKTAEWDSELYSKCIEPYFNAPLMVESWIRGSKCPETGTVRDVKSVEFNGVNWTEYNDHSKWAISDTNIVCFSDINRMTTQAKRGGGAICFENEKVNQIFNISIKSAY